MLADASARFRISHLLALFVAVICDTEMSGEAFGVAEFCEQWERPCVSRLRDQQAQGELSPAASQEIDVFCDFLERAIPIIPIVDPLERERIVKLCYDAINKACTFYLLFSLSTVLIMVPFS